MSFLIGLLAFILMLGVIIMIHEAGHFMAARAFGVHCHEFSFGMGPAIWQKQGKNTLFSIRAFPIGGYVTMAGENDGSVDEDEEDNWLKDVPENERLNNKPTWQQVIIMAAGVVMNFILAAVMMIVLAGVRGTVTETALPVVYEVIEGTPAQRAGLQSGDKIVKVTAPDGTVLEPETQSELSEFLQYNPGVSTFEIERDNSTFTVQIEPELDEESQAYLIGFTAQAPVRQITWLEAIPVGLEQMWDSTTAIFRSLGQLIQGKGLDSLSGPIGIYKVTDQMVSYGWLPYLSLFALISLNIGIFNLIPIPALDGGRIVMLLFERIFRRKIPVKVVEGIIMGSFVLLFGLLIFSTYNDIVRFFF